MRNSSIVMDEWADKGPGSGVGQGLPDRMAGTKSTIRKSRGEEEWELRSGGQD